MTTDVFDGEWIITCSFPRGMYALKDRLGNTILRADTLEAVEEQLCFEYGIEGEFVMLYNFISEGILIPDQIYQKDVVSPRLTLDEIFKEMEEISL